ncbi:hypothetical protein BS333_09370 [Vibrio azureus]|uniref:hypothetical protein n=1 Tax=Vibrio azureus TaxID=512649 RepID=UPI000518A961|nr:hypothetical protein [Vibrio azureus]AUI86573.1 hypothetical protein BS333_09370 [Vibrio azureus]
MKKFYLLCIFIFTLSTKAYSTENCNKIEIPLKLDKFNLPYLTLTINKREYQALFDLGSSFSIHIPKEQVSNFNQLKYTGEKIRSMNLDGDMSYDSEFIISELFISCMSFKDLKGVDFKPWGVTVTKNGEQPSQEANQLVIGKGLFTGKVLTIDYSKNKLVVENHAEVRKKRDELSFPFKGEAEGITVPLHSKNKAYSMVLDTGASSSFFASQKVDPKEKINVCDMDLGEGLDCRNIKTDFNIAGKIPFKSDALLYPFDDEFRMDGILGTDFFKSFVVKINFQSGNMSLIKVE